MSNSIDTLTIDPERMGINHRFGPGCAIDGRIQLPDGALVQGEISGSVQIGGVLVLWTGAIARGDIRVAGDLYLFGTVGDPGCSPDEATIECLGTAYLASSCILNGRIVAKQLHVYQGAELRGQVRSFTGAHKVSPHIAHLGDDTPTSAEANVVLEDIEAQFDSSNLPVPAFSR